MEMVIIVSIPEPPNLPSLLFVLSRGTGSPSACPWTLLLPPTERPRGSATVPGYWGVVGRDGRGDQSLVISLGQLGRSAQAPEARWYSWGPALSLYSSFPLHFVSAPHPSQKFPLCSSYWNGGLWLAIKQSSWFSTSIQFLSLSEKIKINVHDGHICKSTRDGCHHYYSQLIFTITHA